jgi:asparagine synthase (glutamine-hydrolysing)
MPICLLDGTVYDAVGLSLPARSGPELEAFLARAYRDRGEELLTRLRGDFALLLYDPAARRGLLARDQMGGRTAVWQGTGGLVRFATEFAPLLATLPRRPDPDPVGVAHWLAVSGMPADVSLYSGVRRVQAGCALRLAPGNAAPFTYWSPPYERPLDGGAAEHGHALRAALDRAVRRRIGGDERVGVLLSGGLDSGTVAAFAAGAAREELPSYSAVFPRHPSVDESGLIAELGSKLGLRQTTMAVRGGSLVQGALTYLRRFEVPPVSPNLFFWIPLQRRAAEDGVVALIDGEGGDELFGHSLTLLADLLRRGRLRAAIDLTRRIPGTQGDLSRKAVAYYLRTFGLKASVPYRLHAGVRRLRAGRYAPDWMRPEAARAYGESDDDHAWKRVRGSRWFAYKLSRVARGMGPALAYDHLRRRSALAGLETRHPLVDVDVVELVLRLPPELAFDPEHSRPLLRRSTEGLLPDAIRLRPTKSNFDALFHESLGGVDLPVVRALLGRRDAEIGAYVDLAKVADLIEGPPEKPTDRMWWALYVWRLLTAECWLVGQSGHNASPLTAIGEAPSLHPLRGQTSPARGRATDGGST